MYILIEPDLLIVCHIYQPAIIVRSETGDQKVKQLGYVERFGSVEDLLLDHPHCILDEVVGNDSSQRQVGRLVQTESPSITPCEDIN